MGSVETTCLQLQGVSHDLQDWVSCRLHHVCFNAQSRAQMVWQVDVLRVLQTATILGADNLKGLASCILASTFIRCPWCNSLMLSLDYAVFTISTCLEHSDLDFPGVASISSGCRVPVYMGGSA